MDCRGVENLLDRLCDGSATPADQARAQEHLRSCPACRRLNRIARGEEDVLPPAGRAGFTRSVLELTSGTACRRSRELLCAGFDDAPEPASARMLEMHAEHCEPCRRFAATLRMLRDILPTLAEFDPGPGFTAAVLDATRQAPQERGPRRIRPGELWDRLVRRPLFAWEAAYAATVLFALLFLNPLLDVGPSSVRALSAARDRAVAAIEVEPAEDAARTAARRLGAVRASITSFSARTSGAVEAASLTVAARGVRGLGAAFNTCAGAAERLKQRLVQ